MIDANWRLPRARSGCCAASCVCASLTLLYACLHPGLFELVVLGKNGATVSGEPYVPGTPPVSLPCRIRLHSITPSNWERT